MTSPRIDWPRALPVAAAAACGTLVALHPAFTVLGCGAVLALVFVVTSGEVLPRVFLRAAGVLLFGYALFGRSFAYIGYPPLFVGEATLAVGVVAVAVMAGRDALPAGPIPWLLLAFMLLGASRTLPFLSTYGVDAVRDAVVWGYGLYALVVAAALLHTRWLSRVPEQYQRMMRALVWWVPVAWALTSFKLEALPLIPGSSTPVVSFKGGDSAVHLAGAAAFVFLGLTSWAARAPGRRAWRPEVAFWLPWSVAFGVVASFNRGGILAILASAAVTLALGGWAAGGRAVRAGAVAVALGVSFVALDAAGVVNAVRTPRQARAMSVEQIGRNLASIAGGERDKEELEGTKTWRLRWWSAIVDYTVHGPYFWTGKGFGVNLANDDGFQVEAEETLRSPHSGHMSVLARMGVPGMVLWVALQLTYAASLLRAHLRARRWGEDDVARLSVWLLAYWTAFMVNMSFDVYLEGPQGGIWLWSSIGMGLALMEEQRRRALRRRSAAPVVR